MNNSLLTALFACSLFLGCKKVEKDVQNYYPKVKTSSVEQLPDGTVKVTGEILSAGNTDIYFAGFCMDTVSMPGMLSNQISVDSLYGNTFSAIYSSLKKTQKYYFRAWVANGNGYHIDENEVSIDSVTISNSIIPCDPPSDTIKLAGGSSVKEEKYYDVSKIQQGQGWDIDLYTYNGISIRLTFARKPSGGVYKTVSDLSGNGFTAEMMVNGYEVDAGADVYVKEINASEIEVTICEAKVYTNLMGMATITTRFRAGY